MPVVQVPVTKSGGSVSLDTDKIPQEVWDAIILEGAKVLVNKGMSKIATKGLEGEELSKAKAAAQAKAEENAKAILDGTIKLPGRKSKSKATGEIMTEARRLAKIFIKDQLKSNGIRLKDVGEKVITAMAADFLDGNTELMAEATANVEARKASKAASKITLAEMLPNFADLVAKGQEAKAKQVERGKQLSAKQAGMTAKRKPKVAQASMH